MYCVCFLLFLLLIYLFVSFVCKWRLVYWRLPNISYSSFASFSRLFFSGRHLVYWQHPFPSFPDHFMSFHMSHSSFTPFFCFHLFAEHLIYWRLSLCSFLFYFFSLVFVYLGNIYFTDDFLFPCFQTTLRASSGMHDQVFKKVFYSPMSFFDTTPSGRIINIFSRDMDEGKAAWL